MRIKDNELRGFTQRLESASARPKLSENNLTQLLASVADVSDFWRNEAELLTLLSKPGISRRDQFRLVKDGLDGGEIGDLKTILDESNYDIAPSVKNFIEALVGRAQLKEEFGPLQVIGNQRNGFEGKAESGDVIEAINLSTAPNARLHLDNTTEIARADAFGNFKGTLNDVKEGDVVRLRTRKADGTVSDWVTVRASGIAFSGGDERRAQLNLERFDLVPGNDGIIEVTQNTARPITEPGAQVRVTNERTGERLEFTATEKGGIPEGMQFRGRAGDTFKLAVSDGHWNLSFADIAGKLKVPGGDTGPQGIDLPDPTAQERHIKADGSLRYEKVRYTGPLFVEGPAPSDVRQGSIGNCFFPSAMAAIAHTDPDIIRNMIEDNGDGTYTVTFKSRSWSGEVTEKRIDVDADLYTRSWGGPIYGTARNGPKTPDKMELWFPLIEKAYAMHEGGYETIGQGGVAGAVLELCTGGDYSYQRVSPASEDSVFRKLEEAMNKGWPACAGTHGKDRAEIYTNTGVYANHSYSVLGVEKEGGERFVKLRNPWGQSEAGDDGKNDGFFRLPISDFVKLYGNLAVCPV